jgi:hypothetical protein
MDAFGELEDIMNNKDSSSDLHLDSQIEKQVDSKP